MRDKIRTGFFLSLFLGYFGAHKFYQKKNGLGVLYLLTAGLCLIGWAYDSIVLFYYGFIADEDKVNEYLEKEHEADQNRIRRSEERKEHRKQIMANARQVNIERNAKKAEMDRQGIPYCPKCLSTYVQYLDRRKQLSLGRAAVGGALLGVPGAMVGSVTSKKYKGKMKCLKCGHEWKI